MASAQIELEWSFFHPVKAEWMDLGKKGSVQEALIASGELPDPFYGTNEEKFGWIEEHEWEFKSMVFIEESFFGYDHLELILNSVDTYGRIYINDSLIARTDNAFIPHRFQVKEFLKVGMNEITVVITPPVIYHKDTKAKVGYQLPAPNDVSETPIAPYVRKPQYQFGWDWALRMNTIGFNAPAELVFYHENRISNRSVNILEVKEDTATVEFLIELTVPNDEVLVWNSELFGGEKVSFEKGIGRRKVKIANPELWWPRGQGEQFLYTDVVKLTHEDGIELKGASAFEWKFGVRTSELVREEDQWGTSYYFKINGRRIFAKGGDYIPQEIFPARVKREDVVSMVETMDASNFNMVRVWGGGYYPDDVFFETCDELGIMVWEDLMFACAMYPGDSAFLANVRREFEYQVPRISAHPSVVLFNGNNEVEVAWGNWGFQIKYGLYGKSAKEIEAAYDSIFKKLAPEVIEQYSDIPYIHTSPLSNWGKAEYYNHGSQHYWGVWHGKDPIEDFGKKIGRFNAEYGFQSFPEFNTLRSFSEEKDWELNSEVMKHHQKSYVGNDMIMKHAKRLYGTPENFEEFVYFSQLTQSLAVSMAVAGHRLDAPRCGGTLYWQLNDCWPAPTWSSIDYFGNWKALQYRIRDDYRDVTVLEKFEDLCKREYYLISDAPDTLEYAVQCKVRDLSGGLIGEKEFHYTLGGGQHMLLDVADLLPSGKDQNCVLYFSFRDNRGELVTRAFDHITGKYHKAHERSVDLALAGVNADEKTLVVEIKTTHFLRNAWLSSSKFGMHYDRNFLQLMPGTHHITVRYSTPEAPEIDNFRLMWQ